MPASPGSGYLQRRPGRKSNPPRTDASDNAAVLKRIPCAPRRIGRTLRDYRNLTEAERLNLPLVAHACPDCVDAVHAGSNVDAAGSDGLAIVGDLRRIDVLAAEPV